MAVFSYFRKESILGKSSLKGGFGASKAQGKMKFLWIVTMTWCGPCKMMTEEVSPQKEAGDFFQCSFRECQV